MYKKILVPLDGSEVAEAVLPHVERLAKDHDAEIIILRVAVNPAFEFAMSDPAIAAQVVSDMEQQSKEYMAAMEARLKGKGFKVTSAIVEGGVADAILREAEERGADLIAMSTHGRSGMARWLIGSVADKVVRASPLPVLLVRPAEPVRNDGH
jgi:nucleotide-binding universal stress UspA family protein